MPISFSVVFVMYFRYLFSGLSWKRKISCNHQFQRFEAALLLKQRLTNRKVLIANADMISIGPRCALRAPLLLRGVNIFLSYNLVVSWVSIPIQGSFASTIERIFDMRFRSFSCFFIYIFSLFLWCSSLHHWFKLPLIAFLLPAVDTVLLITVLTVNFISWCSLKDLCCRSAVVLSS